MNFYVFELNRKNPVKTKISHQPLDRAASDDEAFTQHLPPDLARPIYLEVLGEDTLDLRLQLQVPLRPHRQLLGIDALGDMVAVGRRGAWQLSKETKAFSR